MTRGLSEKQLRILRCIYKFTYPQFSREATATAIFCELAGEEVSERARKERYGTLFNVWINREYSTQIKSMHRSLRSLCKRGLISISYYWSHARVYELTDKGVSVVTGETTHSS